MRPEIERSILAVISAAFFASCAPSVPEPAAYVPSTYAVDQTREAIERMQVDDYGAALDRTEAALEDDPAYAQAALVRANALVRLGRYHEAAAAMARVVEIRPDFAQGHVMHGVYLEKAGQKDAARAAYAEAVARYEESVSAEEPRNAVDGAIALYLWRGKTPGLKAINEVVAQYPGYARARFVQKRMEENNRDYFTALPETPAPVESSGEALPSGQTLEVERVN